MLSKLQRGFLGRTGVRSILSCVGKRGALPLLSAGSLSSKAGANPILMIQNRREFTKASMKAEQMFPNLLGQVEAGSFSGVLNNPIEEVWETLADFDNAQWATNLEIVHISDGVREVTSPNKAMRLLGAPKAWKVIERLTQKKKGPPHEIKYNVQIKDLGGLQKLLKLTEKEIGMINQSQITVTQKLVKHEGRQCTFTMTTRMKAPFQLTKLMNILIDQINGVYYKGLMERFNQEDIAIDPEDLPLKVSKIIDFIKLQSSPADSPLAHGDKKVKLVQHPLGVFFADQYPQKIDAMTHPKLMEIIKIFAGVPIEKLSNLVQNEISSAAAAGLIKGQIIKPNNPLFPALSEKMLADPFLAMYGEDDVFNPKSPKAIALNNKYNRDEIFAEYFFNGVNPFQIHQAKKVCQIPKHEEFAKKYPNLEELAGKGELYYLDFRFMNEWAYPKINNNMPLHTPVVLLQADLKNNTYAPLGIYVEAQFKQDNKVLKRLFTPCQENKHAWRLAKLHTMVADMSYFQLYLHLTQLHFLTEALTVSIYNIMEAGKTNPHPLAKLLRRYTKGLLGINHFGQFTLVDQQLSTIDATFPAGVMNIMKMAIDHEKDIPLTNLNPIADLKKRGFNTDELASGTSFTYGKYSQKIFNAIKAYAKAVQPWVSSDPKNDADLKALQTEFENYNVKTGVDLTTQQGLIDFIACFIWKTTALHSVTFGVPEYDAYLPFRPAGLSKPLPFTDEAEKAIDQEYVLESLPFPTKQLINTAVLGSISIKFEETMLKHCNPFKKEATDPIEKSAYQAYESYHEELKKIEAEYSEDLTRVPGENLSFDLLKPSNIENSISI